MFYVVSYIDLKQLDWKLPRHDNMTVALICNSPCTDATGASVIEGLCRKTETHEVHAVGSYDTFVAAREALHDLFVWRNIGARLSAFHIPGVAPASILDARIPDNLEALGPDETYEFIRKYIDIFGIFTSTDGEVARTATEIYLSGEYDGFDLDEDTVFEMVECLRED